MKGVEFFPLDVHLSDEVELIEAEYGFEGFAVFIKLLQKIYGGEGYFCDWQDDNALLFSKQTGSENASQIVKKCIERGLFDKEMFEQYKILTSAGIQRRYLKITERRKYSGIKPEYDVSKKNKNVFKIEKNVDIFQQSKVKESKVKESKVNKAFTPPEIEEVKKFIQENHYNINPENFVNFYASKGWMVGKSKMKDWKAAVRGWHSRSDKSGKKFADYSLKTSYDYEKIEKRALELGRSDNA